MHDLPPVLVDYAHTPDGWTTLFQQHVRSAPAG